MALNEYEIKKMMCDVGKRIYDRNMVAANDGNISVKLNDNEFLCLSLIHIQMCIRDSWYNADNMEDEDIAPNLYD